MAKTEPKTDAATALAEHERQREKFLALQLEERDLEAQLNDLYLKTPKSTPVDPRTAAAEEYLASGEVTPAVTKLAAAKEDVRRRLRIVRDALPIQRRRRDEAHERAKIAASEEMLPQHREATRQAVSALIGALVAGQVVRAIQDKLNAADLWASGVLPPMTFARLGAIDPNVEPSWCWWLRDAIAYAQIPEREIAAAFGKHWATAKKILNYDWNPRPQKVEKPAAPPRPVAAVDDWTPTA